MPRDAARFVVIRYEHTPNGLGPDTSPRPHLVSHQLYPQRMSLNNTIRHAIANMLRNIGRAAQTIDDTTGPYWSHLGGVEDGRVELAASPLP